MTKWIFLRGLARGSGHWGWFQEKIKTAFPGDEFYYLDKPGNGLLYTEESPRNISDYIPSLEQQLREKNFFATKGRTIGVGLSLGGMVMTEWSLQNPKLFDQLVLINSSAANFSKPWERLSIDVILNVLKQIGQRDPVLMEKMSLLMTTSLKKAQLENEFKENFKTIYDFSTLYPVRSKNVLNQLIAASRYHFPKKAPVPTLVLLGSKDRFVSSTCSRAIAEKWQARLEIHPTAGHDISFEDADWVVQALASVR